MQQVLKELTMKQQSFFIISFLKGCSSSSHLELWAGDKPGHHIKNGFRNYPLIEPADTLRFKFIRNRIVSSSKTDNIPTDHLIDENQMNIGAYLKRVLLKRGIYFNTTIDW